MGIILNYFACGLVIKDVAIVSVIKITRKTAS